MNKIVSFIIIPLSICLTMFLIGCNKSPEALHCDMMEEMEAQSITHIDWVAECRKLEGMTEYSRSETLKAFNGKNIKIQFMVGDINSLSSKFRGEYYSSNFINLCYPYGYTNAKPSISSISCIIPKSYSNIQKNQIVTVEGIIYTIFYRDYFSDISFTLYPAKIVSQ